MILAEARAERPQPPRARATTPETVSCPFCAGHESETPPTVLSLPDGSDDWQVRVVPNKYPALISSNYSPPPEDEDGPEPRGERPGYGYHEVVIESARHVSRVTEMTAVEWELVLVAYRRRIAAHFADTRIKHVQVFKNVGPAAGATIKHAHSQIIAMSEYSQRAVGIIGRSAYHYERYGKCLLCSEIERESKEGARVVFQDDEFVAYCPFASRSPCESWIVPRQHGSRFDVTSNKQLAALAEAILKLSRKVDHVLDEPDFNLVLVQDQDFPGFCHWHWELIPRVATLAGFEWATGCYINTMSPERAAEALRSV